MVDIACICPPKADGEPRHESDHIELRETLDFRAVVGIRNAVGMLYDGDPDAPLSDLLALLTEQYVLAGISAWTLVDAKGKAIEVSKPAIREYLFPHVEATLPVADAADELYQAKVMLPLLRGALKSLPPTPTAASTSAPTDSLDAPPKPSRPSSISTIPTAATVRTSRSRAGASSSSPSLKSAG